MNFKVVELDCQVVVVVENIDNRDFSKITYPHTDLVDQPYKHYYVEDVYSFNYHATPTNTAFIVVLASVDGNHRLILKSNFNPSNRT